MYHICFTAALKLPVFLCVCMHVRACVCVCMCLCMCVCVVEWFKYFLGVCSHRVRMCGHQPVPVHVCAYTCTLEVLFENIDMILPSYCTCMCCSVCLVLVGGRRVGHVVLVGGRVM